MPLNANLKWRPPHWLSVALLVLWLGAVPAYLLGGVYAAATAVMAAQATSTFRWRWEARFWRGQFGSQLSDSIGRALAEHNADLLDVKRHAAQQPLSKVLGNVAREMKE